MAKDYTLQIDFGDPNSIVDAMKKFGDSRSPYSGSNDEGETILVHIGPTDLILETFQSNGWVRKDFFNEYGELEGQTYDGRWR